MPKLLLVGEVSCPDCSWWERSHAQTAPGGRGLMPRLLLVGEVSCPDCSETKGWVLDKFALKKTRASSRYFGKVSFRIKVGIQRAFLS